MRRAARWPVGPLVLLLALTTACSSGKDSATPSPGPTSFARLDAAVRAVSTERSRLLAAVDAVQAGAAAVDAGDEACAQGSGVAARRVHRDGAARVAAATAAVRSLPGLVATYRGGLGGLQRAATAVAGLPRRALGQVVTDGGAEADAVGRFATDAAAVWPAYSRLDEAESTWITRAVTPWYRSTQEASDAYAVLVGDDRPALDAARSRLGAAATAVRGPVQRQDATLQAADAALRALR